MASQSIPVAVPTTAPVVPAPEPVVVTTGPTPPTITTLAPTEPMSEHGSFISLIDTPGGHIIVCSFLIVVATGMYFLKVPEYRDVLVGSLAVLFAAMRGKGGAQ